MDDTLLNNNKQIDNNDGTKEQVSDVINPNNDQLRGRSKYDPKQVMVQSVHPDGTVECQLLCKQKTINFKFNRFDNQPSDIIEGMLNEDCLNSVSQKTLTEQLNDIIKQLQENPSKIPECWRYVQKVYHSIVNYILISIDI